MSYFKNKALGQLDKSRFMVSAIQPLTVAVSPEDAARIEAFAKLKANWPRCMMTVPGDTLFSAKQVNGYKYTFNNGEVRCSPEWSPEYYAMFVKGVSPAVVVPNLSSLTQNEYFKWVCKAQGNPGIQKGFEEQGFQWWHPSDTNITGTKEQFQAHAHSHAPIPDSSIGPCARHIEARFNQVQDLIRANKGTLYDAKTTRLFAAQTAHKYQTEVVPEQAKAGETKERTADHRAHGCEGQVPPEVVPACEAWLSERGRSNMTPADFMQALQSMPRSELDELLEENPPPPPKGPPILIYGAVAAALGLVAWKVLGKK